ncbi:MAG: Rha family transcriptional regulator [Gammaproteobacteria bacterium]|nr:Rha family transcriptional regulator [Gammaproteobacteria bacterium]
MADLSIQGALALTSSASLTMSSREIAELTGKRHDHVMRDIRNMLEELGEDAPKFGAMFPDAYERPQPGFVLPKDLTITLVSGYSVVMRHRIVTRWQELEQQAARPMTQLEVIAANAQALVMIERQQQAIMATQQQTAANLAKLETAVNEVAHMAASTQVWDHCPQNCEPITKIRGRMLKQYGLPAWVVDMVMRELPLSPKVHGMVRNGHEEAKGMHYEVWAVADVTRTFKRFVDACKPETAHFASHPDIDRRFHIKAGMLSGGAA